MNEKLTTVLTLIVLSLIVTFGLPQVYAEIVSLTVDLQTILLEPNQVIPLLDTKSVGNMTSLQISATLPCDTSNVPKLKIIVGALGNLGGVIDSSSDYKGLRGPFNTCYYEDTISTSTNLPVLNKVFLNNTGSSSIVTNLGSIITITGFINQTISSGDTSTAPIFTETFDTNSGWVQNGTLITVDSDTADKLDFAAATAGSDRRVQKSMGLTLPNAIWRADFEYRYTASSSPSHLILFFTDNAGDIYSTTSDIVGVTHSSDFGNALQIAYRDNSSTTAWHESGNYLSINSSTTYYVTLIRTSTTNVDLKVYSDAARTAQVGSTVSQTIASTIQNLDVVSASVYSPGTSTRSLTATVDNLNIYDTPNP